MQIQKEISGTKFLILQLFIAIFYCNVLETSFIYTSRKPVRCTGIIYITLLILREHHNINKKLERES